VGFDLRTSLQLRIGNFFWDSLQQDPTELINKCWKRFYSQIAVEVLEMFQVERLNLTNEKINCLLKVCLVEIKKGNNQINASWYIGAVLQQISNSTSFFFFHKTVFSIRWMVQLYKTRESNECVSLYLPHSLFLHHSLDIGFIYLFSQSKKKTLCTPLTVVDKWKRMDAHLD